jgi:hypothetical protein
VNKTVAAAVSAFGAGAEAKLSAIFPGAPEDQLRSPLEVLVRDLSEIAGLPEGAVHLIGETSLADIKTRPDFAVTVHKALVGFIEVKAPGKGADPRRFSYPHDKDQWEKLKSLPNLIYTDGNAFSLWRDGKLQGSIVRLEGDIETAGAALSAPPSLLGLLTDFLNWEPIPPKTAKQLAEISARLCRLLREEVIEQMKLGSPALTELSKDWRLLLFPQATDAEFADGYAQAVTFGLLVARARNISLAEGIEHAASELRKTNSLIGTALRLLTEDGENQEVLKTSLRTLTRVLEAVDWTKISKGDVDAWLYFYEDFLEDYDNELRKRTGSYYTPPEVVNSMVRLVDEALRRTDLFDQPIGLASSDVTVADPAVGTGTFLLGVFRQIANTVARACLTKPSALGARLSTCTATASASPIRPMAAPKARLGCSAAVVQLSQAGPQPSTHWRQTTAVTAGQNPARGLAAGIYKRSYRPSECPWTAGRAGTGSERPAGPHLRRSPTDCRRIASRRSARPAEGRSLKEKSRKGRTEDTDQRAQKTP